MKKYLILLMCAIVFISVPLVMYGDSDNNNKQLIINLDQAYKMLEENNIELKLIDQKIDMQQKRYGDALEEADEAKGDKGNTPIANLQLRKTELLNWQLEKLNLNELKNEKTERLKAIKSDVKKQYIDTLLLNEDIEFIKEDIVIIDKKIEEMTLRIKLGQAKETDYKSLSVQKLTLQNQLALLNTQVQVSMINLKKTLGIAISQQINIEDIVLPYVYVDKENLSETILKAVEGDFAIVKIAKELELKNYEIQLTKDYTDYRYSIDYSDLQVEVKEIETKLSYDKVNLEAELWIEYYNLLGLEDSIKLEELNTEIEKINYDTIVAKAKLNMVDAIKESNARISYNRQKSNYQRAMYDYILAAEQLNQKLNIQK